jgi:hypothetical protein
MDSDSIVDLERSTILAFRIAVRFEERTRSIQRPSASADPWAKARAMRIREPSITPDYYERRAVNSALEEVQSCAKALDVSASYIVGSDGEPLPKREKTRSVALMAPRLQHRAPRSTQHEAIVKEASVLIKKRQQCRQGSECQI